jgi:RNA polymerase sigma factor
LLVTIVGKWISKDSVQTQKGMNTAPVAPGSEIDHWVALAKKDEDIRNQLISQYTPFIIKVASKVCKQYIDRSRDEFSIAMQAFNEAVETYNQEQGTHFLSFAEMVIRRRVIDFIRKETRQTRDILLEVESKEEEEQAESLAQIYASIDQYRQELERERRREDIEEYQQFLKTFGITFSELAECCPKHIDARENAKRIAKILAETPDLAKFLLEKKQLPLKELLKLVDCSRKTIERNRKYIIALALIHLGRFDTLRSYLEI